MCNVLRRLVHQTYEHVEGLFESHVHDTTVLNLGHVGFQTECPDSLTVHFLVEVHQTPRALLFLEVRVDLGPLLLQSLKGGLVYIWCWTALESPENLCEVLTTTNLSVPDAISQQMLHTQTVSGPGL